MATDRKTALHNLVEHSGLRQTVATNGVSIMKKYFAYILAIALPLIFFIGIKSGTEYALSPQNDIYFGADAFRVITNLADNNDVNGGHYRDKVHPYFSLFAVSASKLTNAITKHSVTPYEAYRLIFGTIAVFLFWYLIYIQSNWALAFSSTCLLMSSMSFQIWTLIPETYIFSFMTIMLSLFLIQKNSRHDAVILTSLAGTITNVAIGLSYLFYKPITKQLLLKTIYTSVVVGLMMSIYQKILYPSSELFFKVYLHSQETSFFTKHLADIPYRLFDFFVSGFILPIHHKVSLPTTTDKLWGDFFKNGILSDPYTTFFTLIIFVLIICQLLLIYSFCLSKEKSVLGKATLTYIIFELALHMAYGDMPFLYSLNFVPPMILLAVVVYKNYTKHLVLVFLSLALLISLFNFKRGEPLGELLICSQTTKLQC